MDHNNTFLLAYMILFWSLAQLNTPYLLKILILAYTFSSPGLLANSIPFSFCHYFTFCCVSKCQFSALLTLCVSPSAFLKPMASATTAGRIACSLRAVAQQTLRAFSGLAAVLDTGNIVQKIQFLPSESLHFSEWDKKIAEQINKAMLSRTECSGDKAGCGVWEQAGRGGWGQSRPPAKATLDMCVNWEEKQREDLEEERSRESAWQVWGTLKYQCGLRRGVVSEGRGRWCKTWWATARLGFYSNCDGTGHHRRPSSRKALV